MLLAPLGLHFGKLLAAFGFHVGFHFGKLFAPFGFYFGTNISWLADPTLRFQVMAGIETSGSQLQHDPQNDAVRHAEHFTLSVS